MLRPIYPKTTCVSGTVHLPNPSDPCYHYGVMNQESNLTTAQKLERHFYIELIRLVDEVQGNYKLPSQVKTKKKSSWVKQTKVQKQKKDALSKV